MSTPMVKSAETLYPILCVFHDVAGLHLERVCRLGESDDATGYVFHFQTMSLVAKACPDDDTITLATYSEFLSGTDVSEMSPWETYIGEPFGWGWLTTNQQGYLDGVMLSFGSITPGVLLVVAASSVSVFVVTRL